MYRTVFLFFFFVFGLIAAENTIPFRSGKILSAEVSTQKPEIASAKIKDISNGVWAELIVKINPGRKLGSLDYHIEVNGQKYPCRAIARNDDKYDADVWDISDFFEGDKLRILFNPPKPEDGKTFEYEFKFSHRDTLQYPKVTFKNLESGEFTPASKIPAEGVMITAPVPVPAPAAGEPGAAPPAAEK